MELFSKLPIGIGHAQSVSRIMCPEASSRKPAPTFVESILPEECPIDDDSSTKPVRSPAPSAPAPGTPHWWPGSVTAQGFQSLIQKKVVVDALSVDGINLRLQIGATSQQVTVSDAPPVLDTIDARIG
jgi:hypothetical protein